MKKEYSTIREEVEALQKRLHDLQSIPEDTFEPGDVVRFQNDMGLWSFATKADHVRWYLDGFLVDWEILYNRLQKVYYQIAYWK